MFELRSSYPKSHPLNYIAKLLSNSLYGKFGMDTASTRVAIFDTKVTKQFEELEKLSKVATDPEKSLTQIVDIIQFDEKVILVLKYQNLPQYKETEDIYHGLDVNIAISSYTSDGGRGFMSQLKNNPKYKLYYTDTDSFIMAGTLPEHMVGNKLGQFKLEHTIEAAVFIAPKVYALKTTDGGFILKIKGLTASAIKESKVKVSSMINLLQKDAYLKFNQEKLHKDLFNGTLSVLDTTYLLHSTSNKRAPIYNSNGTMVATRPYNYNEIGIKSVDTDD